MLDLTFYTKKKALYGCTLLRKGEPLIESELGAMWDFFLDLVLVGLS